jgi:hypothetical protein
MPYPNYMDYKIAVARGEVNPTTTSINKFGQTPAATTTYETIWAKGGNYSYPSTALTIRVSSDSGNDASAGSGAVNLTIEGLDSNLDIQTATVELTGQTPVTVTAAGTTTAMQFKRVYRAYITGASNGALNDGKIYIWDNAGTHGSGTPTTTTNVLACIASDTNQTLQAVYTIPNNFTGYLLGFDLSGDVGANANIKYQFLAKTQTGPLRVQESGVYGIAGKIRNFNIPLKYSAGTDIEFRAKASATGASVDASFEILLVNEGE